jgi:hypothetical protein
MANIETSGLLLQDVIFEGNKAEGGGGIHLSNVGNTALTDVIFIGNDGRCTDCMGGGMESYSSSPVLTRVTFEANRAETGGGMAIIGGSPKLNDVEFVGNFAEEGTDSDPGVAGGLYNYQAGSVLRNVTFRDNTSAYTAGGMLDDAAGGTKSATLINTVFVGNLAGYGGAIACLGESTASFTNVTISGNTAEGIGGGLIISGNAAPTLTNTIVWGNIAGNGNEIFADDGSGITLSFSLFASGDVEGDGIVTANNSFSADPLFVNAENGDLRLLKGSPAIDASDPDTDLGLFPNRNGNPVDRDGNLRMAGERIDIGAYENPEN